jgi:hypothetical protein
MRHAQSFLAPKASECRGSVQRRVAPWILGLVALAATPAFAAKRSFSQRRAAIAVLHSLQRSERTSDLGAWFPRDVKLLPERAGARGFKANNVRRTSVSARGGNGTTIVEEGAIVTGQVRTTPEKGKRVTIGDVREVSRQRRLGPGPSRWRPLDESLPR